MLNPFQPGQVIVGASFIILALAYGVWYSFSVFFVALLKEFGWSRSIAAGAFSLFVILQSLIAPLVGGMVDRFGPKRVILTGAIFLATGLTLSSWVDTWWQFYLFFGVITAVGVGAAGWVSNVTMIQYWFEEQKGLAIGIVSSGIGIGILFCVPSIQYLILQEGWRTAYRTMALLIPLLIITLAIAFLKKPSGPVGLFSMKNASSPAVSKNLLIVDEAWASRSWTVWQAIHTKQFWLLGSSCFLGNGITHAILTHQVAFFVDHGLEALFASYIVGMVGMVSIGGKILWATLSDRIGREMPSALGMGCSISGIVCLFLFKYFPFSAFPYLFAVFFGLGYAATATLPPLIAADFFEGQAFGRIFGTLMVLLGLGGAFGAWLAGFLHDQMESYLPVFLIMIACGPVASINVWKAAPRKIRRVPGKLKCFSSHAAPHS